MKQYITNIYGETNIIETWRMQLGDGKIHTLTEGCILRTLHITSDQDWKTQYALHMPNIPAGAQVKLIEVFTNLYGRYLRVEYSGWIYDIRPEDVEED